VEAKAIISLDDMELELIIQALTLASNDALNRGKSFRSRLNENLTRKFIGEKMRFEDRSFAILEIMYGINEEKPACQG
jgi:hypothetical protein